MKHVVAAALSAVLILFLIPLLAFGGAQAGGTPSPVATLPPDPGPAVTQTMALKDAQRTVHLLLEGDQVVELNMADYLKGVVAAEMPASFEYEALKAQAVAARTYTYYRLEHSSADHPEADLCSDSGCCQAYIDPAVAAVNWGADALTNSRKIASAVEDTDGLVILYEDEPIQALFHSSSAGRTLDAVEVWGNSVPYLTGVDSPEGDEVPGYHSTAVFTPDAFKEAFLAAYPKADLTGKPSSWFGQVTAASNGGVHTIVVGGVTVTGAQLRSLLSLRSADFTVSADDKAITFSVTGYGHGVGMSQYGANALAKEGKTFGEILKWYYTGVTVGFYP